MAFILRNYMDIFVQNGVVELGAGLTAMLLPNLFFPHTKTNPHATMIARWWSAAVMGLGLTSFLVSTLPASNLGRQYAGVGYLLYHSVMTLLHSALGDPQRVRWQVLLYAGFAAHLAMVVLFINHLHPLGTFSSVISALSS